MTCLLHLLAFGLAMAIVANPVLCHPSGCSRISAAFYFEGEMHFIIGNEVISMEDEEVISNFRDVSNLDFPHEVTAAVSTPAGDGFYLISGTTDQGYEYFGYPVDANVLAYSDIQKAFSGEPNFHGIDAAFEYSGEFVYVSGCSFIFVNPDDPTDVSDSISNNEIGLPCDLDAALYSVTGGPIAIKGNQVWQIDPDTGAFAGPIDINYVLWGLTSFFNFCPNGSESE